MIKKKDYITPKSGIKIANKGIFDFKNLCNGIKSWGNSRHYDFTEKEHTIKHPKRGTEVKLIWIFLREVDDYTRFTIQLEFFITDMINVKSEDKLLDRANMEVYILAFIEFDYKKKWKGPLKEVLINIYNNYIIKDKIKNVYEINLYSELMELHDKIKDLLEMYK